MKKTSFYLNVAASALFAVGMSTGFQSCAVADNSIGEEDNPEVIVDNGIKTTADFLAAVEKGGLVELAADAQIELTEPLYINVATTIAAPVDNPATLILGEKASFIIQEGFSLLNIKVDATALTEPLIAMNATPAEDHVKNQDVFEDAAVKDYFYLAEGIGIENSMIKNLKNSLVSINGANWAVSSLTLNNNIIQLDNASNNFLAFDKGGNGWAKYVAITGNTIYNISETSNAYFVRCGNASNASKIFGTNNGTATHEFVMSNNTIINTFGAKPFGNNTPNNKATSIIATNNVFVDVFRLNKFIQGNNTKVIENNFIAVEKTASVDGADGIAEIVESVGFKSPTQALDLTAADGGLNLQSTVSAGDGRWIK